MNCIDNECRHVYSEFGELYCDLTGKEIPDDIDITQCANYLQAHTCIDCVNAKCVVYETGIIDEIDYICTLQNNKTIYCDINPMSIHYADVPECRIGKFKKGELI